MKKFNNKVVWITGASSGIGEALVKEFSKYTSKIILSSRREDELMRVKESCSNNSDMMILPLDLTDFEAMEEKAKQVHEHYGQIDILVNNGGVSQRALTVDTTLEVDMKIMNINYFGTIAITKAVLPYMIKQKDGHIIVVSSVTGKIGVPLRSAYAASKHALFGFFDTLRAETYPSNISVTMVCPGYIHTQISINAFTGNGTPQNKMDKTQENGMTAEELARRMLKAASRNKQEVYIGGKEIMGIYIRRFFPRLFSKIIRKQNINLKDI